MRSPFSMTLGARTRPLLIFIKTTRILSSSWETLRPRFRRGRPGSRAFVVVQGAFSWFTENYAHLSEWAASANRVASLLLALDQIDREGENTASIYALQTMSGIRHNLT
jgi:ABC-type uncharacterized transport system fused permease/ATPase subunit